MQVSRAETSAPVGYIWMSIAVLIWASWLVLTSSGRVTELATIDLAGFRALIPTVLLAPILWRQRREIARLGITRCLLLSAYGAPFAMCVGYGLSFAPVALAGALVPGLMPIFAAILGFFFLGHRVTFSQILSILLILAGALALSMRHSGLEGMSDMWAGHAFFLIGALLWACFAVTMKTLRISPYLAMAIVSVVSTAGLAPFWFFSELSSLTSASAFDILFQAVFQGIISGLISLFAFSRAIRLLGSKATAMSALTPAVATLLAVPMLGQIPDPIEVSALVVVVAGLLVGAFGTNQIHDADDKHKPKHESSNDFRIRAARGRPN